MLMQDKVKNFIIKQCGDLYQLNETYLKEIKITEEKVSLKYERSGIKMGVEFELKNLGYIIYSNFITEKRKVGITQEEFTIKFNEWIENIGLDSIESIEKVVTETLKQIEDGKLVKSQDYTRQNGKGVH